MITLAPRFASLFQDRCKRLGLITISVRQRGERQPLITLLRSGSAASSEVLPIRAVRSIVEPVFLALTPSQEARCGCAVNAE
jgi:hypothetical protein